MHFAFRQQPLSSAAEAASFLLPVCVCCLRRAEEFAVLTDDEEQEEDVERFRSAAPGSDDARSRGRASSDGLGAGADGGVFGVNTALPLSPEDKKAEEAERSAGGKHNDAVSAGAGAGGDDDVACGGGMDVDDDDNPMGLPGDSPRASLPDSLFGGALMRPLSLLILFVCSFASTHMHPLSR
jgi:hypothetical protein